MKTIIDLPDDVLRKTRVFATERGTTLRDLVVQGLKLVMEIPPEEGKMDRKAAFRSLLEEMRADNTEPMVPLTREEANDRSGI